MKNAKIALPKIRRPDKLRGVSPPAHRRFFPLAASLLALACLLAAPPRAAAVMTPPAKIASWGFDHSPSGRPGDLPPANQDGIRGYGLCAYEPASGRPEWLRRDPIGERGGLNLYAFVGNNEIDSVDILGMATRYDLGYQATLEKWKLSDKTGKSDWMTRGTAINKSIAVAVQTVDQTTRGWKVSLEATGNLVGKWLNGKAAYEYSSTTSNRVVSGQTVSLSLSYEVKSLWEERMTYPTEWSTYKEEWINLLHDGGSAMPAMFNWMGPQNTVRLHVHILALPVRNPELVPS